MAVNIRYTLSWCIFGVRGFGDHSSISPCSETCRNISDVVEKNILNATASSTYDYCNELNSPADLSPCASCFSPIKTQLYLSNCKLSTILSCFCWQVVFLTQIWVFSVQHANSRFPYQPPFPSSDPKSSQAPPLTTIPHPQTQLQTAFPTEQNSQSESPFPQLCFYSSSLPFSSGTFATTGAGAAAYQTKSPDSPPLPPNLFHTTNLSHRPHL